VVALSSCEAKYIAGTAATCQAVWLAQLLGDLLRECEVALESVGTADQLADILTKPLTRVSFEKLRGRISVIKLTSH
jgi:hypothetical protein